MRLLAYILFLLLPFGVCSQNKNEHASKGNKAYANKEYKKAQEHYNKEIEKFPDNLQAIFNTGDALFREENYEKAGKKFEEANRLSKTKEEKALANHNMGNSYLKQKKYKESVEAYKNALRNNSTDEDTRYNLAYAMEKLKQEEQKKQEQQKKKEEQKEQQQEQQHQEEEKMSKEEAERMLKAYQNQQKTKPKKVKEKGKARFKKRDKDW